MADAEVILTGYLSEKKYPESFRLVRYYDEEDNREFIFLRMQNNFLHWMLSIFIRKDGNRAVLQMAQAASQDKEILEYNREYCSYIDQCGYYHILSCGYCLT